MLASGPISSDFGLAFLDNNNPFISPNEPMRVTGQDSNGTSIACATFSTYYSYLLLSALHENQQLGLEAYAGTVGGANFGALQAPSDNIQDSFNPPLNFDSNEYYRGSSGFPAFQCSLPVPLDLGGPSCERSSARSVLYNTTEVINYTDASSRACVNIKMASPEARDERTIEHRRDIQLKLEVSVSAEPFGVGSTEYCIGIPKTKSVKGFGSRRGRTVLDLRLEVVGATTGKALMSACRSCSIRESSPSTNLPMVDFVAKEDLINVKRGKAYIAFRFRCLPGHHGTMDEEYQCANITIPKSIADVSTDCAL